MGGKAKSAEVHHRYVSISELVLDEANPRTHPERNVGLIASSLREFGQVEPILIQRGTNRVIAGHGRIEALRQLGLEQAEVREIDVDDGQARRLAVLLNRTSDLAGWDAELLQVLLDEADQIDISAADLGFSDDELDALAATAEVVEASDAPEQPEAPPTQFQVLVICHDARTQRELAERLAGEGFECRTLSS